MEISIYITSFNQKKYLAHSIESVLNQSLKPDEILILDDCSEDGSQDLISEYAIKFPEIIKYHFNSQNIGISKSRNIALELLNGEYVSFLDGDDFYYKDKLKLESEALKTNTNADIVFSNFTVINQDGNALYDWELKEFKGDLFDRLWAFRWPKGGPFRYPLVNLRSWREIGKYDESLEVFEDLDMMLRLSKEFSSIHIGRSLSAYRKHTQGISNQSLTKIINILRYIYQKNTTLLDTIDKNHKIELNNERDRFLNDLFLKKIYDDKEGVSFSHTIKELLKILAKKPDLLFSKKTLRILLK